MANIIHNENKIVIPFLGVIFLLSIAIIAIQNFTKVSFGFLGVLAWIIVILGAVYFILWVFAQIFG